MLYGKYIANGTIELDATVKQLGLDDLARPIGMEDFDRRRPDDHHTGHTA